MKKAVFRLRIAEVQKVVRGGRASRGSTQYSHDHAGGGIAVKVQPVPLPDWGKGARGRPREWKKFHVFAKAVGLPERPYRKSPAAGGPCKRKRESQLGKQAEKKRGGRTKRDGFLGRGGRGGLAKKTPVHS